MSYMVGSLFVTVKVCGKKIRKEEEFHHHKKDEKLYKDDQPKSFTDSHLFESGVIEHPDIFDSFIWRFKEIHGALNGLSLIISDKFNKKIH